jgi:hypothetical protein
MKYTDEYVLKMPARRFFSMRKALADMSFQEQNRQYFELCQIQAIAGVNNLDYYNELVAEYRKRAMTEENRKILSNRSARIFDADNPEESKYAANVLQGFFGSVSR